jgi:cytoskeleton protein RodZ
MAAEAGGDIRAGIGTRLRAAREKKGLTILQAAEKMHVDAKILESLEAENFAALGAPVYARGHLRHYAELVGEPPAELQELYANSTKAAPAQPDLTRIARMVPESDPGKLVAPTVIVLVAVALMGTVWWLLSLSGENAQPATLQRRAETHSTAQSAGAGSVASSANPAAAAESDNEGAPVSTPAAAPESQLPQTAVGAGRVANGGSPTKSGVPAPPSKQAIAKASTTTAGARTTANAATTVPGTATAANAATTTSVPRTATNTAATTPVVKTSTGTAIPTATALSAPSAKEGELTLKFSSDSWAEVYDASGQRLFYDVGAASSAHTVKGPAPMRVVLGNASGVAVEFNGRPALIPAGILPDGSARFVINARGRTLPAGPASDGD